MPLSLPPRNLWYNSYIMLSLSSPVSFSCLLLRKSTDQRSRILDFTPVFNFLCNFVEVNSFFSFSLNERVGIDNWFSKCFSQRYFKDTLMEGVMGSIRGTLHSSLLQTQQFCLLPIFILDCEASFHLNKQISILNKNKQTKTKINKM